MKHIIVGTAGHIDHGKTTLIRALTGRNTDRLKEEQERGITIELGFTYFDLPSGKRAGIIDVPGHEKFIKQMLAGAASVDVVVLVIAADEGVMPQTKEHMDILSLLQVKQGIIALTKIDMVDADWLELITEQVREEVAGTFLNNAKIIPVSGMTGEGIPELIAEIDRVTDVTEGKDTETSIFRLPVDRVFSISGFGTVVTGTLLSGEIQEGEKIEIYPNRIESRVRTIQVHDQPVKIAEAGQRVALNIANVKVEEIHRGDVIAKPGSLEPSMMLDARLELLRDAERSIDNRTRLRLYHETAEVMCRVILLDREELKPGEAAFVQLRLEEELACQKNDRFVVRFYSPMVTIGGGTVLDPNPPKRKRFREDVLEELKIKETGDPAELVEQYIKKYSGNYLEKKEIMRLCGNMPEDRFQPIVKELEQEGKIHSFPLGAAETYFIHSDYLQDCGEKCIALLTEFHKKNPLKAGMSKEEVKKKVFEDVKGKLGDALFSYYENRNEIRVIGQFVALSTHKIVFTPTQTEIRNRLIREFNGNKFNPPRIGDLVTKLKEYNTAEVMMVYQALLDQKELMKVDEEIVFSKKGYDESIKLLNQYFEENGSIQLGNFRDLLGTSRKYAMALLDYFDQIKLTKRDGDKRTKF